MSSFFFLFLLLFSLFTSTLKACTDFVVPTKEGSFINGRSLEFALDLQTELKIFSRNISFQSKSPHEKKGVSWTSKYGYLSATIFGSDLTLDGLNEEGLSFGFLWLPGAQYMEVAPDRSEKGLDFVDFGNWVLGNFSNIAELKKRLGDVVVWGHLVPPLKGIPPVHVAIHDRFGNHLVIEFIQGEMKVYDNPNTVLTNYPTFDWHLTNLQNYIGLNALNAAPIQWKGMNLAGTGQGSGFLGMPGDWTPPSRFVRMSALLRFANTPLTALEGVCLAEHLLNAVDIPKGEVRSRDGEQDYTQWIVIKDLTNRVFYFRSYNDLALKFIDLKKVNFRAGSAQKTLPINHKNGYVDVTNSLN